MLKAFIVDDEPLARDELTYFLRRSKQVEVIGEADCIQDAIEHIQALQPDVVFLDIELAEDSGLQLAEKLLAIEPAPAIVFATAYDEYALQAFNVNALDYILKPFDEVRIQQTIEKIERLQATSDKELSAAATPTRMPTGQTGKIAISTEERILLIDIDKILFINSAEGKTLIKTLDNEYKIAETLVMIERKLQYTSFTRVHRSYLVNVQHIAEIQPWFNATYHLIMREGSKVPVSRNYVKELKQLLGF
ncbi:LytR/AlgR family response regulator transcription factor [Paenibacillus eucommiae]|uniref:Two-component system response regulator LytT n=1 Tax=Paenibacillus eucommiae TaxID=1355755 RepID=A0ABS4J761_9BACL|nr:LytTR family transcriptional regulator DNA-binding domain-containing protein [Paenibacillus eucommiae]MBP1995086.1 two-component system response regulator LytT [Paenibacillus eucommiae]